MTFGAIKLQLANLAGHALAEDLDEDETLCESVINEAYLGCYAPVDDRRPRWARRPMSASFRAPVTATLTLTQGSKAVTGYAFNADMVGSIVNIGTRFFTYAGLNGAAYELLEAWPDATGAQSATIYHSSYTLDASTIEFLREPELQGVGPLSAMPGREVEALYRADWRGDFEPAPGAGYWPASGMLPRGSVYQTGTPIFYRVDCGSYQPDQVIRNYLKLLPLPGAAGIVTFEANVVPAVMTADTDVVRMPADVVQTVFMPIVRGRWAQTYKKYTGLNKADLIKLATDAQTILSTMGRPQRQVPMTMGPRFS